MIIQFDVCCTYHTTLIATQHQNRLVHGRNPTTIVYYCEPVAVYKYQVEHLLLVRLSLGIVLKIINLHVRLNERK